MDEDEKILNEIRNKPTVPVFPHVSWAYNVSKNKAYDLAKESLQKNSGEFVKCGRTIRAVTRALRQKLGIE
jgi:hypothetical protein